MKLSTFTADFGNFELKYLDSAGQPRAIRSIHFRLPRGVNALKAYENSPVIEANGTRYHFGTQANKYSSHEKTVVADKALLARLHLYACISATEGSFKLVLSHHSPDLVADDLRKALIARHQFTRNGKQHDITVKAVEVVHEGLGAYWAAKQAGFVPPTGHTILIDLGGGTWLSRVIDSDGEIIASNVADRMGAYALASQIAHDSRLKDGLRRFGITSPDPGVVMDGFTRGHVYAETGVSWGLWLDEYLDGWFKNIFAQIRADYTNQLPYTRRFIICGGGAHLVAHKLTGKEAFVVMPQPNYSNVIGMAEHYTQTQLQAVA